MSYVKNLSYAAIVLMALPLPFLDQSLPLTEKPAALTSQIMGAATETFADMRNFCGYRPDLCAAASDVATRIETRATYSLGLVMNWANETAITTRAHVADYQAFADSILTGSFTMPAATAGTPALRGTIPYDAAD